MDRGVLEAVHAALLERHGPQHWWPADSAFEVIVGAILIQRTAWRNAELALARLRGAGALDPERLAASAPDEVAAWVRPAGFYRHKSVRLIAVSRWLQAAGGIAGVAGLADEALAASLRALPGIGDETADAISLYAFERPVFVIDAYARRLFARLGLIRGDEPYAELRAACESALARDAAYYNEYHALIVAHGKQYCRPRPRCTECVLAARCTVPRGGPFDLPARRR